MTLSLLIQMQFITSKFYIYPACCLWALSSGLYIFRCRRLLSQSSKTLPFKTISAQKRKIYFRTNFRSFSNETLYIFFQTTAVETRQMVGCILHKCFMKTGEQLQGALIWNQTRFVINFTRNSNNVHALSIINISKGGVCSTRPSWRNYRCFIPSL